MLTRIWGDPHIDEHADGSVWIRVGAVWSVAGDPDRPLIVGAVPND